MKRTIVLGLALLFVCSVLVGKVSNHEAEFVPHPPELAPKFETAEFESPQPRATQAFKVTSQIPQPPWTVLVLAENMPPEPRMASTV